MTLLKKDDYKVKFVCDDLVITCEHMHKLSHVMEFVHMRQYAPYIDRLNYSYSLDVYKNGAPILSVQRKNKLSNHYQVVTITKDGVKQDYTNMYPSRMCSIPYCVRMCNTIGSTYTLKIVCASMCLYRCTVTHEFAKNYNRG